MENLKELFIRYESAFNTANVEAIAAAYAEHFIMTGPDTSACFKNDAQFHSSLRQAEAFYHSIGMKTARIVAYTENTLDLAHTLVELEWALFRDDGSELVAFDVTYLVRSFDGSPKIILFIAHNEQERLREKGLLDARSNDRMIRDPGREGRVATPAD